MVYKCINDHSSQKQLDWFWWKPAGKTYLVNYLNETFKAEKYQELYFIHFCRAILTSQAIIKSIIDTDDNIQSIKVQEISTKTFLFRLLYYCCI